MAFPELVSQRNPFFTDYIPFSRECQSSLGRSLNVVMAAEPHHQQLEDSPISSFPDAKSSDDMSSSNVTDREPYEKAAEAEANVPQQQKPVGGPPGGPPPNGGTTAWLQVLGGFFLFFNTWVCTMGFSMESLVDGQHFSCLPFCAHINELNTNDTNRAS